MRKAAYADPGVAGEGHDCVELESSGFGMAPLGDLEVSESERFPELMGRRSTDIARERGMHSVGTLCDLAGRGPGLALPS